MRAGTSERWFERVSFDPRLERVQYAPTFIFVVRLEPCESEL